MQNYVTGLCGDFLDLLDRYDLLDWLRLVERLVSLVLDLDLRGSENYAIYVLYNQKHGHDRGLLHWELNSQMVQLDLLPLHG